MNFPKTQHFALAVSMLSLAVSLYVGVNGVRSTDRLDRQKEQEAAEMVVYSVEYTTGGGSARVQNFGKRPVNDVRVFLETIAELWLPVSFTVKIGTVEQCSEIKVVFENLDSPDSIGALEFRDADGRGWLKNEGAPPVRYQIDDKTPGPVTPVTLTQPQPLRAC
jgi:hypothetical protein